ncbi:hypothetical protein NDU88_001879 [Pleurodeles waltl]|uniref:Uncharacterized protein n=1 Tax=Pleurodeles waltl TaxID=8319 RepID=A0AAV7U9Q1_PLEWA|nr:hypothetical protein NDU88_001879 [Pleurodeles waltl]
MSFGEALSNGAAPCSKECCIPASSLVRHTTVGLKKTGKTDPFRQLVKNRDPPVRLAIISAYSFRSVALRDRLLSQLPCSQPSWVHSLARGLQRTEKLGLVQRVSSSFAYNTKEEFSMSPP